MAEAFVAGAHHMEAASGTYFDLSYPEPGDVKLRDIAHALSMTCRFGGHSRTFYSVAEHAVLVSARLRTQGHPIEIQLAGLHHDDSEAYLGDVQRPLKLLLGGYLDLERRVSEVIREALGIGGLPFDDLRIKTADDWALAAEAHHLMPSCGVGWFTEGLYNPEEDLGELGQTPAMASACWILFHNALKDEWWQ